MANRHVIALGLLAAVTVVWLVANAVAWRAAALPPQASGTVLAIYPAGPSDDDIFAAIVRTGARPVRPTLMGMGWVVHDDRPGLVGRLEAQGALAVFSEVPVGPALGGCAAVVSLERLLRQAGVSL